jgi:hypothetical protein
LPASNCGADDAEAGCGVAATSSSDAEAKTWSKLSNSSGEKRGQHAGDDCKMGTSLNGILLRMLRIQVLAECAGDNISQLANTGQDDTKMGRRRSGRLEQSGPTINVPVSGLE